LSVAGTVFPAARLVPDDGYVGAYQHLSVAGTASPETRSTHVKQSLVEWTDNWTAADSLIQAPVYEIDKEVLRELEFLFKAAAHEDFESTIDNSFIIEFDEMIALHGTRLVTASANILLHNRADPEVVAIFLRWLGGVKHQASRRIRFGILVDSLSNSSRSIRDGAALGLVAMREPHAILYLRRAISQENIQDLRLDLEAAVSQIERNQKRFVPNYVPKQT